MFLTFQKNCLKCQQFIYKIMNFFKIKHSQYTVKIKKDYLKSQKQPLKCESELYRNMIFFKIKIPQCTVKIWTFFPQIVDILYIDQFF